MDGLRNGWMCQRRQGRWMDAQIADGWNETIGWMMGGCRVWMDRTVVDGLIEE